MHYPTCFTIVFPFCGENNVEQMQNALSKWSKRDPDSIATFYDSISMLKSSCSNESFIDDLDLILATRRFIDGALINVDRTNLDPLIPTLFNQFVEWGEEYPKGFHLIHDDSKTLASEREIFEEFMTKFSGSNIELGYDRRKFKLPSKASLLVLEHRIVILNFKLLM